MKTHRSEEYPVYYRRKPAPIRMHTLTASLTVNVMLACMIALYSLGYLHTSRTTAVIKPGAVIDAPDYVASLDAPAKPVALIK